MLLATGCATAGLLVSADATATAPTAYTAYVAVDGSGIVIPIDAATNTAATAVDITTPTAVAITPSGVTALVTDWTQSKVIPITLSNGTAGTPIDVGTEPDGIAITPNGTRAYVANYSAGGAGSVTAITLSNVATSTIPVGDGPHAIAITPDGSTAYVANSYDGTVTPITIATDTAGTPIVVGAGGGVSDTDALAVSPNGDTVYAANHGSNDIVPIAVATNTPGTALTGIAAPLSIAINPAGTTAYIGEDGTPGHVVSMNLSNDSLGTAITVGNNPLSIAITPDDATAYVANYNSDGDSGITPIDLATGTAESSVTGGYGPAAVAITPDQAPVASFVVTRALAGSPSSFDASASTVSYGSITDYHWNFGDGSTAETTTPTTTHTYATAGDFSVTLAETDSAGTSTTQTFTGNTMSRNGGASAQTTRAVTIESTPQVTLQPAAASVPAPASASFTVACAGSPAPSMQWQSSANAGATWTNLAGATSATLTLASTEPAQNGEQYRAVCTNAAGSVTSNQVTLSVIAPPMLGVDFQVQPHGVVLARTAPGGPLLPLGGTVAVPVGTLLDAQAGSVTLVFAMTNHRTQRLTAWHGSFIATQPRSQHGLTHIALAGGSFAVCSAPHNDAHSSAVRSEREPAKPDHVVRELWSKDDHGQFQTHGENSVATVRGTEWETEDRCDGTLTRVMRGVVSVRSNETHHGVTVTAGHSYLARR